ncbi:MAG: class beta-lactamase-related serine hydrolase [Ilumatobacteraceae bacterium]|nr:class beta-lactamase-related serine hydrolase [Ilumatobacteraceae bacterium]
MASGFSAERLVRMHEVMAGFVERGEVPGIVTLLSRHGEAHVDVIGARSFGGTPMQRDTIFRIASMTKPITALATMMLLEECVIRLDEPVDRLLPELADRRVLTRLDGPLDDTVPAKRPISVRDLLTFRMGSGMLIGQTTPPPIQTAIAELQLQSFGPHTPHGPDEWMRRFGTLPLMDQPGEVWRYNTGSELLGVLIARASGQPLETFLRERIFDPLGMVDTGFSVPVEKRDRLASAYVPVPPAGEVRLFDGSDDTQWGSRPAFPSGGGGLVSTVDDYHAFARLLANGGVHDGQRLVSRASIEAMTADQLTAEQQARSPFLPAFWDTFSWGFGLSMVTRRTGIAASPGRYGWDGAFNTSWGNDPREDLTAIFMPQRLGPPLTWTGYLDFWTSTYQALAD